MPDDKSASQPIRNLDQFNRLVEKFETFKLKEDENQLQLSRADVDELIEGIKVLRSAKPL